MENKDYSFSVISNYLTLLYFPPNFSTTAEIVVTSSVTSVLMEELLSLLMKMLHKFEFVIAAWYIFMP